MPRQSMQYSGILVLTDPPDVSQCRRDLGRLAGVEVHHTCRESGRIVVVQESETIEAQEEGLRTIGNLPRVKMAALVHHYVDSENEDLTRRTG